MPFFYYDAFLRERGIDSKVIQAFVGYSAQRGNTAVTIKAGRLTTAFGSFALRYDDADNPVIDQPLSYITILPLRADQLECGTNDLLRQSYGAVAALCGGTPGIGPGVTPLPLYGMDGVQADVSTRHFDGRLQMTTRSPSNRDAAGAWNQYLQFTAGGGFTIRQGFRVGVSEFRGPYLDRSLASLLPAGTTIRDFRASGFGVDGQWARGRWSVNGEWQRLRYEAPHFVVPPSVTAAYAEAKSILTPRFFVAGRAGWLNTRRVVDLDGVAAPRYAPTLTSIEAGCGAWLDRRVLVKASYSILHSPGAGTRFNVLGVQVVSRLQAFEKAFR
jgi:hypothetical protein